MLCRLGKTVSISCWMCIPLPVKYFHDPSVGQGLGGGGYKCGEVSVQMLLHAIHIRVSLPQIIDRTGNRGEGSTPRALEKAACDLGAKQSCLIASSDINKARKMCVDGFPFIAFISPSVFYEPSLLFHRRRSSQRDKYLHSLVLLQRDRKEIIFHDPDGRNGGSNLRVSIGDFLAAWQPYDYPYLVVRP